MTDYSIIVPAYNEERLLPATLDALRRAMRTVEGQGELIVVDNNSTDRTDQVARAAGAHVVFEPVNQISRARNAGARAARGCSLVFVDADTVIEPALLQRALANLRSGRCCGGGALIRFEREVSKSGQRGIDWWDTIAERLRLAAGCFFYCRHDAFEDVGGFSERVFASEEIWLSRRLGRWGRRRGMDFCIITQPRPITSSRKLDWHSTAKLALTVLVFLFFPWAVHSRTLCGLWYKRPEE